MELHERLEVIQTERDALHRQLEQSEASRARYREEVMQLRAHIEELEANVPAEPSPMLDLCHLRDQVLKEWRVAKKGETRERIELAINKFIEKLQATSADTQSPTTKMQNNDIT